MMHYRNFGVLKNGEDLLVIGQKFVSIPNQQDSREKNYRIMDGIINYGF